MGDDESFSTSMEHSDNNNPMTVATKAFDSSKKRKYAEESDLLPQPKRFCLEQQAPLLDSSCQTSNMESAECSYVMENSNTGNEASSLKDSIYLTESSCSDYATLSIDQYCSKANHKTQEDDEDFTYMEFICPPESEFAVDDLTEVLNPVESYILSSASWSINNQDSEATTKPTIDQEFKNYFSTLMM